MPEEPVSPPSSRKGIKAVFAEVPRTYELVNHVLTGGLDIFWRRKAARAAAAEGGDKWLDVCSGTGEMAAYLARLAPEGTQVFAADFSEPMLAKARAKPEAHKIEFIVTDVRALPFPDNTFDAVTISFATRNLNVSEKELIDTFAEFYRVLKPGGRFINVETSQPPNRLIRFLFYLHVKLFVKPVGILLSRSRRGYAYLSHTIPRFYPARELAELIGKSGFKEVTWEHMFFGSAAIHIGRKAT